MTRVPREREPRQFNLANNDAGTGNDHASAHPAFKVLCSRHFLPLNRASRDDSKLGCGAAALVEREVRSAITD